MKRIGIIRGGDWDKYEKSLEEGGNLISYINENLNEKYETIDVFIDRNGIWHIRGLPIMPSDLAHRVDLTWNTSHAGISQILNNFSVPNIGIPPFAQALKENKEVLKKHIENSSIRMPAYVLFPMYQEDLDGDKEKYVIKKAKEVFNKFSVPWIVKAYGLNKDLGIRVAKDFKELMHAIYDLVDRRVSILVEELIEGKEENIHSIRNFRGEDVYVFPAGLRGEDKDELHKFIKDFHNMTSSDYLSSVFILNPKRGIYLKSIDFTPDFNDKSLLNDASKNIGVKVSHILESILESKL